MAPRFALLGAALALGWGGVSWAGSGDPGSTAELQSEVQQLQQEIKELKGEVSTMKSQAVVKAPAAVSSTAAAPAPATVGEHVGAIEKDVADIKSDLATNLGVHIHGLVDVPYEYNLNHPNTSGGSKGGVNSVSSGGSVNQLRVFDTEASGFNLQQFNLHLDRTADGGVGFVSDLNFGEVANVLRASTRNSNINTAATSNDVMDLTQAYLTYTVPVGSGIALQLGRFVTLLGAEVIPTYSTYGSADYNISRDFIFGFGIPFTHTGLRGTYTLDDKVSFVLGVNNGWDDVTNNNDGQTLEAELNLSSGDMMGSNQSLALALNSIWGAEQVNRGSSKLWAIDPILTYKTPIKGLQLIGEYLYAQESGPVSVTPGYSSQGNQFCDNPATGATFCTPPAASGFTAGPDGTITIPYQVSWTGAAGYIVYDLTDNVELATRGEWFDDPNGARTGLRQTLGEITETLNYKVPAVTGLLARLEYRHDESNHSPFFNSDVFGPPSPLSGFPTHTRSGQDTFMADAVYSF
jgi:Putative beta-barrel porin-2, OmpL-like. bbp2